MIGQTCGMRKRRNMFLTDQLRRLRQNANPISPVKRNVPVPCQLRAVTCFFTDPSSVAFLHSVLACFNSELERCTQVWQVVIIWFRNEPLSFFSQEIIKYRERLKSVKFNNCDKLLTILLTSMARWWFPDDSVIILEALMVHLHLRYSWRNDLIGLQI